MNHELTLMDTNEGFGDHGEVLGDRRQGAGRRADIPGLPVSGFFVEGIELDRARVLHAECEEKGPRSPVWLPGMVIGACGASALVDVVLGAEGTDEERVAVFFGPGGLVRNAIRCYTNGWSDRDVDDLAVDVAWSALLKDAKGRKSSEVSWQDFVICEGRR